MVTGVSALAAVGATAAAGVLKFKVWGGGVYGQVQKDWAPWILNL